MKAEKTIVVRACRAGMDLTAYERGWDAEETHIDNLKEAKARAKYFLTDEYRNTCEASERLMYSQVVVNGEVVADYFGKVEPKKTVLKLSGRMMVIPFDSEPEEDEKES